MSDTVQITCPRCKKVFTVNTAYLRRHGRAVCPECGHEITVLIHERETSASSDDKQNKHVESSSRANHILLRPQKIIFVHPVTRERKEAPVGFSWTTLLLGVFVPLYRGDWKWTVIMAAAAVITWGVSWFVFPFIYNKLWIKDLVARGFKVEQMIGGDDIYAVESLVGVKLEKYEESGGRV